MSTILPNITGTDEAVRTVTTSSSTESPTLVTETKTSHNVTIDLPAELYGGSLLNASDSSVARMFAPTRLAATFTTYFDPDHGVRQRSWWTLRGPRVKKDGTRSETQTCEITVRDLSDGGADDRFCTNLVDRHNARVIIRGLDRQIAGDRSDVTALEVVPFEESDVTRTLHKNAS